MDKGKGRPGAGCHPTPSKPDNMGLRLPKPSVISETEKRALQPGGVTRPLPKSVPPKPNNFGF